MLERQNASRRRYSEPDASIRAAVERLTPFWGSVLIRNVSVLFSTNAITRLKRYILAF